MRATAAALLALTGLTATLTVIGVHGWVRLVVTLAFVLTAPGWALTAYLPMTELSLRWITAIAAGVSLVILLAQAMVQLGWWHPAVLLWALVVATSAVLAHHLRRFAT